jgi:hypothetical protein
MALRASLVAVVALSLAACASQEGTEVAAEEPVTAQDSAIVGNILSDTAEVHPDYLVFDKGVFPTALRTRVGNRDKNVILAGDRQKDATDSTGQIREGIGNPHGFIRRAVSIEDKGNKTIVRTEKVALDEAFQEFREGRVIQVGAEDTESGALKPQFDKSLHYTIPVINMNGKELWSQGGASVRLKTGFVNLDTTVDLGADISWFSLHDAHVVIDAAVDSELVVEASLAGPFSKEFSKEVYRGSWPIGSIGPVPVTLGLVATVGCKIDADGVATASAGVGMNIKMKGGVKYNADDGGTSPVWENPRFTPRAIAPQVSLKGAHAVTRCSVRPQLSLMLFDAAGPTLTPDLAAKVDATYAPLKATLTGEIGLDVGGKMEIFGKSLGEVNYHLFTVDKQLWKYGY